MLTLDESYLSYLNPDKCFQIDGKCERVTAYGFRCNGTGIIGYYVQTINHKLYYNLQEQCIRKEDFGRVTS